MCLTESPEITYKEQRQAPFYSASVLVDRLETCVPGLGTLASRELEPLLHTDFPVIIRKIDERVL